MHHASFQELTFIHLWRGRGVSPVNVDGKDYPPDVTGNIVYARLQRGSKTIRTGSTPQPISTPGSSRAETWAQGGVTYDLAVAWTANMLQRSNRDVFVYFIHEGKLCRPAWAGR